MIPMDKVSELLFMWIKGNQRPENGSYTGFKIEEGNVFPYIM